MLSSVTRPRTQRPATTSCEPFACSRVSQSTTLRLLEAPWTQRTSRSSRPSRRASPVGVGSKTSTRPPFTVTRPAMTSSRSMPAATPQRAADSPFAAPVVSSSDSSMISSPSETAMVRLPRTLFVPVDVPIDVPVDVPTGVPIDVPTGLFALLLGQT